MKLPQSVVLNEIGPRLQLQSNLNLSNEQKLNWIHLLAESGVLNIEVSSFVRTNQKKDFNHAAELVLKLKKKESCQYSVLVPNKRGLTRAFVVDADQVNLFISSSETYNHFTKEATIQQTVQEIKKMVSECNDNGKNTRVYITSVFGCPFEGSISIQKTIKLANQFLDIGIDEISFVDSVGKATPPQIQLFLEDLLKTVPTDRCSMQFYNTYGRAISNVYTSLDYGIHRFDSSNGGYGGLFPSNEKNQMVATEDILSLLTQLGIYTSIDEQRLQDATQYIVNELTVDPTSKLFSVMKTKKHL
ncbi:hydroxymethylglutaryl-CoA lyase [Bacillus sp. JJ664]